MGWKPLPIFILLAGGLSSTTTTIRRDNSMTSYMIGVSVISVLVNFTAAAEKNILSSTGAIPLKSSCNLCFLVKIVSLSAPLS